MWDVSNTAKENVAFIFHMAGSRSYESRKLEDESDTLLEKVGTETTTQLRIVDDLCSRSSSVTE